MSVKLKALVKNSTTQNAATHHDIGDVSIDKVGRIITTPFQIRELLFTAFATLTRGTETSLITGNGVNKFDIVSITGANTSGIAQNVDIRFGTAGAIIDSLTVGATATTNKQYAVPLIASEIDQSITATNSTAGEHSDSPVSITITGIKNI